MLKDMFRGHQTSSLRRRLVAGATASVAAVALAVRRGDSTAEWAIAACIVMAAMSAFVVAWRPDDRVAEQAPGRRPLAVPATMLTGALLVALVAPALARQSTELRRETSPQATVRDFLSAAVVEHNGIAASGYITPRARASFEAHSAAAPDAASFFATARLTLAGLHVQSNHQLDALTYRVESAGADRVVEVSRGVQAVWFELVPASPAARSEFRAPPTPWRIDSNLAMLGQ